MSEPSGGQRVADHMGHMSGAADGTSELPPDGILASISEGFVALDDLWRLTYLNPAAERLVRRQAAELIGRTPGEAFGPAAEGLLLAQCVAAKASGEPAAFSAFSELLDVWLEVRGYPYPGGFAIFLRDGREMQRQDHAADDRESALAATRAINQRVFETSLDLILVVDRRGNVVRVSPSASAILGYEPAEMAGHSATEFLYPEDLESTRTEMRLARRGQATRNFECRYVHKDGRVVPLSWTGVWSEPERQHFFIGRDMTDRLAAEQRLRHAERLEAVGKLTGGIAHDFNNLLSVVIGNADLVLGQGGLGPETHEHCRAILHAAQRGAELTRQLLAFARQQPLQPKVVDANALIGNISRLMARALGESIELSFNPGRDLWPVLIDPANLEAAIANLAINARDAMPDGGRLLIETANTTLDRAYVRSNPDAEPGEYVVVVVTDTGDGMASEVLQRVFEPFFTTKETGKGTGLGLSMVFGFVKQSGGHIKAYSEVGLGTTFRLYLPRAVDGASADAGAGEVAPVAKAGRQERILVVEDNDAIRRLVLRQLARLGYRTLEAADAAAALAVLEAGEAVELLFTDVVMPGGMSGQELVQQARQLRPGLKVVYTSGFPGAVLGGGGEAVLSKPYRTQDLARTMREALDG